MIAPDFFPYMEQKNVVYFVDLKEICKNVLLENEDDVFPQDLPAQISLTLTKLLKQIGDTNNESDRELFLEIAMCAQSNDYFVTVFVNNEEVSKFQYDGSTYVACAVPASIHSLLSTQFNLGNVPYSPVFTNDVVRTVLNSLDKAECIPQVCHLPLQDKTLFLLGVCSTLYQNKINSVYTNCLVRILILLHEYGYAVKGNYYYTLQTLKYFCGTALHSENMVECVISFSRKYFVLNRKKDVVDSIDLVNYFEDIYQNKGMKEVIDVLINEVRSLSIRESMADNVAEIIYRHINQRENDND